MGSSISNTSNKITLTVTHMVNEVVLIIFYWMF